jgi:L-ascorbate peroxidase
LYIFFTALWAGSETSKELCDQGPAQLGKSLELYVSRMVAYVAPLVQTRFVPSRRHGRPRVFPRMTLERGETRPLLSRRALLSAVAGAVVLSDLRRAEASVSFDIDRFGDKELKVAAINSVKQSCRNVLAERPDLLPSFFVLCLHDALTYNAETLEGGPNGSLRFELDRPENAELRDAVEALTTVRAGRRDAMSFGDIFAFAGAVAVEVTGGPRIVIQLGREDASKADPAGNAALNVSSAPARDLLECFESAGLNGARDVVLMHGGFGSLNDISRTRLAKLSAEAAKGIDDEDDEYNDGLDDVTYGKVRSKKRGAVLVSSNVSALTLGGAKLSNAYLKFLVDTKKKGKLDGLSDRDRAIVSSAEMMPIVEQYANNNRSFLSDVGALFEKISLLGSQYESLKFTDS